jgi:hypothetical protein
MWLYFHFKDEIWIWHKNSDWRFAMINLDWNRHKWYNFKQWNLISKISGIFVSKFSSFASESMSVKNSEEEQCVDNYIHILEHAPSWEQSAWMWSYSIVWTQYMHNYRSLRCPADIKNFVRVHNIQFMLQSTTYWRSQCETIILYRRVLRYFIERFYKEELANKRFLM